MRVPVCGAMVCLVGAKCAALVGASLEVFDRDTGVTVATIDNFVLAPVDRAEPPAAPVQPGKK